MDSPGSKGPLPFKTMDIKAAFQSKFASQARKRKLSPVDDLKKDCKALKLSNSADENEVEIIHVACDSTKSKSTISNLECGLSDCKENTDLNVVEDKLIDTNSHPKTCDLVTGPKISNAQCSDSLISNADTPMTDVSFSKLSSDDLNSSFNNSTLNSTLNITASLSDELSDSDGNASKSELPNISVDITADGKKTVNAEQKEGAPKKKRKMSPEEAKLRAEEREKKQKEKEARRKELEAKRTEKQREKERKQWEREKIMKEKQLRKEEEELQKKEREKQRQEKKEQEEKEKQERIKEREMKILMKQQSLEFKMEERKRKEEQKQKQLEERKKAEEEKKKLDMEKELKEKEKKEKAKAHFFSFFVKKNEPSTSQPVSQPCEKEGGFLPFQVSDDMILAPVIPAAAQERFNKEQLDNFLKCQNGKELYLQNLKSGSYKSVKPKKKDKKVSTCDAEVILIDKNEQAGLGLRAKLLQFCENVRPPYWGTWRKTSATVKPRNPFHQDEVFDYSVDSDDEWDEGGPGESLSGTEDEKESEDDYEVDNEFFVPHGYLSAEEEEEDDSPTSNDPEEQKALLKIKLQEFEKERKKKTTELKPIILGCYIENDTMNKDSGLAKFLENYEAELLTETPILTSFNILLQSDSKTSTPHPFDTSSPMNDGSAVKKRALKKVVPEEAMPYLVQLLHANTNRRQVVMKEFQEFWIRHCQKNIPATNVTEPKTDIFTSPTDSPVTGDDSNQISKRQLDMTIHQIASYGKCPNPAVKKCWWVHDEVREKYGLLDAPVPNKWEYVSQVDTEEVSPQVAKPSSTSIKQFLNP